MSVLAATDTPDTTDRHGQRPYDRPDLQLHTRGPPASSLNHRAHRSSVYPAFPHESTWCCG